jgi:hypothetical protein
MVIGWEKTVHPITDPADGGTLECERTVLSAAVY